MSQAPASTTIDARYRGLLLIWLAQLSALILFFVPTQFVRVAFNGGRDNTLRWILGALGTITALASFLLKRQLLAQAAAQRRVDLVTTAYVLASALCEATGVCALVSYFVSGAPYHVLWFIGFICMLLHVPRRASLQAAAPSDQDLNFKTS